MYMSARFGFLWQPSNTPERVAPSHDRSGQPLLTPRETEMIGSLPRLVTGDGSAEFGHRYAEDTKLTGGDVEERGGIHRRTL